VTSNAGGSRPHALRAVVRQEEVRSALHAGQLTLHYLPVIDLSTGRARGVEALIRWQHPRRGLVPPDDFLPAVAHTPLMKDITRWVLDQACREAQRWPGWTVSVNVAARDVTDRNLPELVWQTLTNHELDAGRLILELTEHAVVSDLGLATEVLGHLRELGVGLSLDDFGTGYSSLLYLRELPLTEVKIDRVFVRQILNRPDDAAIVESVARLGSSVRMEVVAEGVDSVEAAERVRALGCGSAQGYLWGRPCAAKDLSVDVAQAWQPLGNRPVGPRRAPIPNLPTEVVRRIEALVHEGASLHTIAAALNSEGLRTPRSTRWHPTSVAQAIAGLPPEAKSTPS